MAFHDGFQRDGALIAAADSFERGLGQVDVLEIVQMLKDRFADIKNLGTPGAPGELLQSAFDGGRESNGQHRTSLYKYSTSVEYRLRSRWRRLLLYFAHRTNSWICTYGEKSHRRALPRIVAEGRESEIFPLEAAG